MKKFLILQMRPENDAANSEFEAFLRVGKINRDLVDRIRLEQNSSTDIDLENYSAIIAGGSPFDVLHPEDQKSEVQLQIESFFNRLFDQVIQQDFPFLGACSGNGLLGKYCGATISRKFSEPVGSVTVTITRDGEKDALLSGSPSQFPVLVGHKEACENVPQGAVLLATSETCPIQMFRIKNNIYATQFHPEADIDEFILRIKTYDKHGYFPPDSAQELITSIQGIETPTAKEILRRFAMKYKDD